MQPDGQTHRANIQERTDGFQGGGIKETRDGFTDDCKFKLDTDEDFSVCVFKSSTRFHSRDFDMWLKIKLKLKVQSN